jgi:hypothetical protein
LEQNKMNRKSRYYNDADDLLQDGQKLRVPMYAMDSVQRDVARNFTRIGDATGDPMGLRRPGWRIPAYSSRSADISRRHRRCPPSGARRKTSYQDELTSVWKHPPGLRDDDPITGAGTHDMRGMKPGDPCSASGAGKENVVPDAPKASGNDAMPVDDIETAYRLYAEEISQAWKTPR